MILDSHLHVWNAESDAHPWRAGWGRFAPRPSFSATDALAEMDRAGVDRAVLVPTEWDKLGSALIGETARAHPDRFVAFGSVSLRDPMTGGDLTAHCAALGLSGLRQIFLPRPDGGSLLDAGSTDWLWDALEASRLPVMVWLPGQLDRLERLLAARPGLRVVIDHANMPMNPDPHIVRAESDALRRLAGHVGVAVKASALPCVSNDEIDRAAVDRMLVDLVAAFGAERVFWGSDLTRLPCSYTEAIEQVRAVPGLSETEIAAVLGDALAAWLAQTTTPVDRTATLHLERT